MRYSEAEQVLDENGRARLVAELAAARAASDTVFARLQPGALYDRPIQERHRLIFYLGHLEAFDANLLRSLVELPGFAPDLDELFARGIDPLDGTAPTDTPGDWPSADAVRAYGGRCRAIIDAALSGPRAWQHRFTASGLALEVAIEHRLMHVETLAYLLHQLPIERLLPAPVQTHSGVPPQRHRIAIPAGAATLGRRTGFGWDNERDETTVEVAAFAVDTHPVTNRDFLAFVHAGGYQARELWSAADWTWRTAEALEYPRLWRRRGQRWLLRALLAELPLPLDWPVYVSHAEAQAYARWAGARLPTEAEWHRAAYGAPAANEANDLAADGERAWPWGTAAPGPEHGNFDLRFDDPVPVTAHPAGASAWGIHDLVGNGWEWTKTPFAPLPGFEPFPFYPGYSADFFDDRHFVLKGGSPRTAARLLRRSFRNWFQPHYPYVYATFRCVEGSP